MHARNISTSTASTSNNTLLCGRWMTKKTFDIDDEYKIH